MIPDPDDIFTRTLLEPATQELLARLPKAVPFNGGALHAAHVEPQTGDCDGGHGEIINAQALLRHLCEVLNVPLADLVKTVEAMPRWVPARDVPQGTPLLAYATQGKFLWSACAEPSPIRLSNESHEDLASRDFYLLVGPTLYPKPPKVGL